MASRKLHAAANESRRLMPEYSRFKCDSYLLLSLYRLALAQGPLDMVDEYAAALQAKFAGDELAVAIQKKRGREHADAAISVCNGIFADQDGVVDSHFLGEFCDVFSAGVVHGYADY